MKVKNLIANDWCPRCLKAKSYTYNLPAVGTYDNDPGAVELPATCTCDGSVSALPFGPTVTLHVPVTDEQLRTMVRTMVAEALAEVRGVPGD